jgi:hypothetical protein
VSSAAIRSRISDLTSARYVGFSNNRRFLVTVLALAIVLVFIIIVRISRVRVG